MVSNTHVVLSGSWRSCVNVSNLGRPRGDEMQTVIAHGRRSARVSQLKCLRHARREGPCRGLASLMRPQRPLPAGCSWEKAAMRRPERQPQRSLRQSASAAPSPPLYRMCHDVRSSASWPTKSVSRRQQNVSTVSLRLTPHPSARCLRREAPRTAVNSMTCGSKLPRRERKLDLVCFATSRVVGRPGGALFRALPHLTDHDLKDIGVLLGHRRIMLAAIAEFAGAPPEAPKTDSAKEPEGPRHRRATASQRIVFRLGWFDRIGGSNGPGGPTRDHFGVSEMRCAEMRNEADILAAAGRALAAD